MDKQLSFKRLLNIGEKFLSPPESRLVHSSYASEAEKAQVLSEAIERETQMLTEHVIDILEVVENSGHVVGFTLVKIESIKRYNAISHGPEVNNPFPEDLPSLKLGNVSIHLDTLSFEKHFRPTMLENINIEPYVFFVPNEKGKYTVVVLYDEKQILKLYNDMEQKGFVMPVGQTWKWHRDSDGKLTNVAPKGSDINYKLAIQTAKKLIKSEDSLRRFIMLISEFKAVNKDLYKLSLQSPEVSDKNRITELEKKRTLLERGIFSESPTIAAMLLTDEQYKNANENTVFSFLRADSASDYKTKLYEKGFTEALLVGDYEEIETLIDKEVALLNEELKHINYGKSHSKFYKASILINSYLKLCAVALQEVADTPSKQKFLVSKFLFTNELGKYNAASLAALVSVNTNDNSSFRLAYELVKKVGIEGKFSKKYSINEAKAIPTSAFMRYVEAQLNVPTQIKNNNNRDILLKLLEKHINRYSKDDFIKNVLGTLEDKLKHLKYDRSQVLFSGKVIDRILDKPERYRAADLTVKKVLYFADLALEVGGKSFFHEFLTTPSSENRTIVDLAAKIAKNTMNLDGIHSLWDSCKQHHCMEAFATQNTVRELKKAKSRMHEHNHKADINLIDEILEHAQKSVYSRNFRPKFSWRSYAQENALATKEQLSIS